MSIKDPNFVAPIDDRSKSTPGAETKLTIVPTESQNRAVFIDTSIGHSSEKPSPVFPSK